MSLLPPKFQDPLLKTLGPPIRKEQENKPVEVEVSPGIWRVNGKLETRFPAPVLPMPVVIDYATIQTEVSEVDIPLPEFKPVWRSIATCKLGSVVLMRDQHRTFYGLVGDPAKESFSRASIQIGSG